MSYLGIGVSPGNVPIHHRSNLKVIDKRVRLAELILRCLICGLAVLAAVLIGTDSQVRVIFSIQKKAKFTDVKSLVFLVIANGLAAAYSLVQVIRCILIMIRGSVLFNKSLAWAIFSSDQAYPLVLISDGPCFTPLLVRWVRAVESATDVCIKVGCLYHTPWDVTLLRTLREREMLRALVSVMGLLIEGILMAYLTLAAVAAAAQSAVISKLGQTELQWMKLCDMYGKYCNQAGKGVASSVIASLSMIVLSGISAFSLFRLYGNSAGKGNAK